MLAVASALEPGARPAHDVNMQVVDFLTTFKPGVYHDAETPFRVGLAALLQRQARCQRHHAPQQGRMLGLGMGQRWQVQARHHQKVDWCPRVDVMEGKNLVVFIDFAGRNLAGNDFAEKAVGVVHGENASSRTAVRKVKTGAHAHILAVRLQPLLAYRTAQRKQLSHESQVGTGFAGSAKI